MIAATIRWLGGKAYRLAFFAAALYLLWRGVTDLSGAKAAASFGLGGLCLLQFLVLVVLDYRRAKRATAARKRLRSLTLE